MSQKLLVKPNQQANKNQLSLCCYRCFWVWARCDQITMQSILLAEYNGLSACVGYMKADCHLCWVSA